jgi:HAMP domain-containing protein
MIGSTLLISFILSYNWYSEIVGSFKTKLLSSALTYRSLRGQNQGLELQPTLKDLQNRLNINHFYTLPHLPKNAKEQFEPYPHHYTVSFHPISKAKLLTIYLPSFQKDGFLAAEASLEIVYQKFQKELMIILFTAAIALTAMTGSLLLVAKKIVRPIQKLNNSALAIAAGQYGEQIKIQGPKELKELSNTLSTMSECLYENINRLKENSLIREKAQGEYECAMLLQNYMLQKVIDECPSDAIAIKAISFYSYQPRGFLLDFPSLTPELLQMQLVEAKESGFEDMYLLLTNYKLYKDATKKTIGRSYPSQQISILKPANRLVYKAHHLMPPLIWSTFQKALFSQNDYILEPGDFIFLGNSGFASYFSSPQLIRELIEKVFSVFAEEGLDTAVNMLKKELSFALKRKELENDLHLICLQVLY